MPTPAEYLDFFYPYLAESADPRAAVEAHRDLALAIGQGKRPACLSADEQDQAQAHYAAYVLEMRKAFDRNSAGGAGATTVVPGGELIEKRQGDVTLRYSSATAKTTGGATTPGGLNAGASRPYAAWLQLAQICGAVDGTNPPPPAEGPKRRGAMITRYGTPQ